MGLGNYLSKWIGKIKISSEQTVVIDIPATIYYEELAIYTAQSYLANAISMCEMRVFSKGKPVKNEDYYLLNVSPNKNENSNYFWHKVIRKMIREEKGALVVEINVELHCAEDFSILEERPILGNIYGGVVLAGGLQLNKIFTAQEVYLFKMEDENICNVINGLYAEYGKMLVTAARAFKFKVNSLKAGDEEFAKDFSEIISKNIKAYMENEYATYVEYEGEELTEESSNKPQKSSEDFISIRKDIFEVVGQAFKIPASMMLGSVTNVKDVLDIFLTFAVDPLANTISEVLNKRATAYEYTKGNYYKCYNGRIKHRDLFDSAANVEKIVGSAVLNTDEVREELELMPLDTEWSKQYRITKNFQNVEDATENVEGGEYDG